MPGRTTAAWAGAVNTAGAQQGLQPAPAPAQPEQAAQDCLAKAGRPSIPPHLLGARHAKTDAHGLVCDRLQLGDQALHPRLHVTAHARHACRCSGGCQESCQERRQERRQESCRERRQESCQERRQGNGDECHRWHGGGNMGADAGTVCSSTAQQSPSQQGNYSSCRRACPLQANPGSQASERSPSGLPAHPPVSDTR